MFTQLLLLNNILFVYVNGKDMTEISINDLREPEQEPVNWNGHLLATVRFKSMSLCQRFPLSVWSSSNHLVR